LGRVLWFALALWVIIGGAVLVIALAGGPRRAREDLYRDTRRANRTRVVVLCLIAAGGLAVPIAVGVANGAARQQVGPVGIKLTKSEARGRALFAQVCANCHTLAAAAAVGHVGPDLDTLIPNEALVEYAIQYGFARGNGQMPAGIYTGQQAKDVSQFVARVAGRN
jgi:mono/diheme cytochrome c family protein